MEGGAARGGVDPTNCGGGTPRKAAGRGCSAPPALELGRGGCASRGAWDAARGGVDHAPWLATPAPAAVFRAAAACALVCAARIAALSSGVGPSVPPELGIAARQHCVPVQGEWQRGRCWRCAVSQLVLTLSPGQAMAARDDGDDVLFLSSGHILHHLAKLLCRSLTISSVYSSVNFVSTPAQVTCGTCRLSHGLSPRPEHFLSKPFKSSIQLLEKRQGLTIGDPLVGRA